MSDHELTPEDLIDEPNDEDTRNQVDHQIFSEEDPVRKIQPDLERINASWLSDFEEDFGTAASSPENADKKFYPPLSPLLKEYQIDPFAQLKEPPVCLSIKSEDQFQSIATPGNISLIIGKPKSRKTFFANALGAAGLGNCLIMNRIQGSLPKEQNRILYFDTEQSPYDAQRSAGRTIRLAGISSLSYFPFYGLRTCSPMERIDYIERIINSTPKLGLVIIDGIRDCVSSINDEKEAIEISGKLMTWTQDRNLHIVCILHQNKNDYHARGHLGTELTNKAETVLVIESIDKGNGFSIVKAEYCKNRVPQSFAFEIDDTGLPVLFKDWEKSKDIRISLTREQKLDDLQDSLIWKFLVTAFKKKSPQRLEELKINLQSAFEEYDPTLGKDLMGKQIKKYVDRGLITHKGKESTRNSVYELGTKPAFIPMVSFEKSLLTSSQSGPDELF